MATATETLSQHFEVGTSPAIRLRNLAGTVQITAGSAGSIGIVATKKASAQQEDQARDDLSNLTVELRQDGDTLYVEGKLLPGMKLLGGHNRAIDFVITLPTMTAQDLHLNAGDLTITGTQGALALEHNAGDVRLDHVTLATGSSVELNAGNATLTDCIIATDVEIKHNAGDVTGDLALSEGARLALKMNAGSVRLTLPAATSARLVANVTVGDISIAGFPITPRRHFVHVRAEGDLTPNPQGTIEIALNAGDIRITAR